jgi:hypothetical protein
MFQVVNARCSEMFAEGNRCMGSRAGAQGSRGAGEHRFGHGAWVQRRMGQGLRSQVVG